jgi:hypothetical protein
MTAEGSLGLNLLGVNSTLASRYGAMRPLGHQLAPRSGRVSRLDCCTYCCSRSLACKVRPSCRKQLPARISSTHRADREWCEGHSCRRRRRRTLSSRWPGHTDDLPILKGDPRTSSLSVPLAAGRRAVAEVVEHTTAHRARRPVCVINPAGSPDWFLLRTSRDPHPPDFPDYGDSG